MIRPDWLKKRLPPMANSSEIRALVSNRQLHTVCQEAKCPNIWECFSRKTATFLIMGNRCTRDCRFCGVEQGPSGPPDPGEPARLARTASQMNLKYVVVTSVTRDDLPMGGAAFFAETIYALRKSIAGVRIEVLIPDFCGDVDALELVIRAGPDVLNHNIETVPRLYSRARPQANYRQSLDLLNRARSFNAAIPTKSGLMLGLGESDDEARQTLDDLRKAGCRILTIGQYLPPSKHHLPVDRFVTPEAFNRWRIMGKEMGFLEVAAGPFVRSSYHAQKIYLAATGRPA